MKKTIKIKKRGWSGTVEWLAKEEGSWYDHNQSEDHLWWFLTNEYETPDKYMYFTVEQARKLLRSIEYQLTAGYDAWDATPLEVSGIKRTWAAYRKDLINALKNK